MSFFQKIREALTRFMQGRHGTDNLGMFTLFAGLALSLLGMFTRVGVLSIAGLGLYVWTIFRMFSRNNEARLKENRKYIELTSGWKTKFSQMKMRMKNRKEFRYFKCPQCKTLLRSRRGEGEKTIHCPRCGREFHQKT